MKFFHDKSDCGAIAEQLKIYVWYKSYGWFGSRTTW